jgi:hypothetical protein
VIGALRPVATDEAGNAVTDRVHARENMILVNV